MSARGFQIFSHAYRAAYAGAYRRFVESLAAPRRAQDRLLAGIVRDLAGTEYGRQHDLAGHDRYEAFASKLPIVEYGQLSPWIERQIASGRPVISPGGATFYERTSGSSGASKPIPYTRTLQRSFVHMFLLWVYDCLAHGPRLRSGRTFLSVSPCLAPRTPAAGKARATPQDDTEFLPVPLRWLFGRYLVVPPGLSRIADPNIFRRALAASLLSEPALEVLSVWNPSYLSSLLQFIEQNRGLVARDLRAGQVAGDAFRFRLPDAAASYRMSIAERLEAAAPDFQALWPQLKLLSCWTDASAALVLEPLRRRLPHVPVQGKGLVSTESPITVPLWQASAPVPLVTDVFLEFAGDDGSVRRLHEIETGGRYDLIITQRSGLARYRIGDRVEVVGRFRSVPTLRFVGRSAEVSDLVGEKLNEGFVRRALGRDSALYQVRWILLPTITHGQAGYLCLYDGPQSPGALAQAIDERLQAAHHYRLARQLGQLEPLRAQRQARLDDAYLAWGESQGRTWGNVKPCALLSSVERAESFLGYLRAVPEAAHGSSD
jgi:hypothetical protein